MVIIFITIICGSIYMKKNFSDFFDIIFIIVSYLLYFYLYFMGLSIFSGQQRDMLKQMNKYAVLLFILSLAFRICSLHLKVKAKMFSNIFIGAIIALLIIYIYKFYPITNKILFICLPLLALLFKYLYDVNIRQHKKLPE